MATYRFTLNDLRHARSHWLKSNLDQETRALCARNGIDIPLERARVIDRRIRWGDWKWHSKNRITKKDMDLFLKLFPEYNDKKSLLQEYLKDYVLGILPLNLSQREGVKKFLPRIGLEHSQDPYGVQRVHSVITREAHGKKYYLTTHKSEYGSFLPILGHGKGNVACIVNCSTCYRAWQILWQRPLLLIHNDGTEETIWVPEPSQQVQWLVEEWNTKPELSGVYDILFSGGEPLMLPNSVWKKILEELKQSTYLRCFRICTGFLFLGAPFRFNDEFINLLIDFRKQSGVQVKLAVHVSHPEHITPEAVYFARKLIKAGIELLPQCPLEPGVNFWMDNLGKTEETLRRLDRLLSIVIGTRTYKWILDMQGGVSLLSTIEMWRRVHDRHQIDSDITRPTSCALFLPLAAGNLNLSFHSLWAIEMVVDKKARVVRYRIPHSAGKWVVYEESLFPGINDDVSYLEKLKI